MADPIRQLTITPALTALIKDVFSPSAKLLGTELKSYLKEKFDDARERRRNDNLVRHITVVRESLPEPPPEQIPYERLEMFSEWVEGAQDVSDSDPELADMWRQLLREIVQGQPVTKSLLSILKQVDPQMAQLLLRFSRRRRLFEDPLFPMALFLLPFGLGSFRRYSGEALFHARRLEAVGLLDRDHSPLILTMFLIGIAFVGAYFVCDHYLISSHADAHPPYRSFLASNTSMGVIRILYLLFVTLFVASILVPRVCLQIRSGQRVAEETHSARMNLRPDILELVPELVRLISSIDK